LITLNKEISEIFATGEPPFAPCPTAGGSVRLPAEKGGAEGGGLENAKDEEPFFLLLTKPGEGVHQGW